MPLGERLLGGVVLQCDSGLDGEELDVSAGGEGVQRAEDDTHPEAGRAPRRVGPRLPRYALAT